MSDARLSETKRSLLDRYLSGSFGEVKDPNAITPRPPNTPVPLSLAQEQLWLRSQKDGLASLYNETITIRRSGPLDCHALERALAEIVRRHEILRTTYDTVDGRPIQVIHPAPDTFPLTLIDLRGRSENRITEELQQFTSIEAQRPFDLRWGPLLRVALVRTADTEYRLAIVAHLSIIDGVSVYQVLPSELAALYNAFSEGKSSPLEELSIQYGDYAFWQRSAMRDAMWGTQCTYWKEQLAGELSLFPWAADRSMPILQACRGGIHSFALDQAACSGLKGLSRREGVTLFTALLTSFASLLYCYTGKEDILIGTPSSAGRKRREVQGLFGYFLNPVPVRISLTGDPSSRELLKRVQQSIGGAISHDDLPIEVLAERLQLKMHPEGTSLITVGISLQPQAPDFPKEWKVTSMDANSGRSPWALYLAFIDRQDGMIGRAQYNSDVFDTLAITQILEDLSTTMQSISSAPDRNISSLRTKRFPGGEVFSHSQWN